MSFSSAYSAPLAAGVGTTPFSDGYTNSLQAVPGTSQSDSYAQTNQTRNDDEFGDSYPLQLAAYSGGTDGSLLRPVSIPQTRYELESVGAEQIEDEAVQTNKIKTAAVVPQKLDRSYQEQLETLTVETKQFFPITAITPPTNSEVNDEDVLSFPDGSISGVRCSLEIPPNFDTTKGATLYLRLSPSTIQAADFYVQTDFRRNGGGLKGTVNQAVQPAQAVDSQTLVAVRTFAENEILPGDNIVVLIKRLGDDGVNDSHTGVMQLVRAVLRYGV